ncbi:unnamed protein product [Penicillium salamii]|uniref:Uncharacterized protein n=1 Tax=Penicillium salamii TaxID=1612424 RepID=A0A9W4JB48_9EURO|nr:unnamed protein product [Penicillium salamii]CAG8228117.1 unnamed protein product [Penicillium salamii]CAG8374822.1 unnamed protein product [Penicillium salamii]CAG8383674.1 unnamed protein product [Penicillium salamii]CAG8386914.1 unnamed protein product [Penicillium salamii]
MALGTLESVFPPHKYRHLLRPHSIITSTSVVYMASSDSGLTRNELTAIVSIIIFRLNHKPFRKLQCHPATYDGNELILQYSPLWRFGTEALSSAYETVYALAFE